MGMGYTANWNGNEYGSGRERWAVGMEMQDTLEDTRGQDRKIVMDKAWLWAVSQDRPGPPRPGSAGPPDWLGTASGPAH